MTGTPTPAHIRQAAVDDYLATREPYAVVAARHGVSGSCLHSWVNAKPRHRERDNWQAEELAYVGGWVMRGGVMRPLFPERRSA